MFYSKPVESILQNLQHISLNRYKLFLKTYFNLVWHVNPLLGYATEVMQPTSKHLATEYTLRNNRGSGVFFVPCRAEPQDTVPTQHATMTAHRTRSGGISRDHRISASDVTHPSPGSLLRYGSVNAPSRQQGPLYDWGFYKRNWNV
jgi:hypothetical protein